MAWFPKGSIPYGIESTPIVKTSNQDTPGAGYHSCKPSIKKRKKKNSAYQAMTEFCGATFRHVIASDITNPGSRYNL